MEHKPKPFHQRRTAMFSYVFQQLILKTWSLWGLNEVWRRIRTSEKTETTKVVTAENQGHTSPNTFITPGKTIQIT